MTKQLTRPVLLFYIILVFCSCKQNKHEPLFRISDGKNYGFIDTSGKIVIKPSFNDVGDFNDGLALSHLDSTYGFIDETGKYEIAPNLVANTYPLNLYPGRYKESSEEQKYYFAINEFSFSDGLALYFDPKSQKFGYINDKGKIVIEPKFLNATKFKNGYSKVMTSNDTINRENRRVGLINKKGEFVIPDKYFNISHVSGNFLTATLCIKKGKGYEYTSIVLNKAGRLINTVKMGEAFFYQDFSNGYARGYDVLNKAFNMPYYFIYDSTGNFLKNPNNGLPLFFDDIVIDKGRYIWVKKDNVYRWFILESNSEFRFVDNNEYEDIKGGFNNEGIASVKYKNPKNDVTLYGYIDSLGKFVLEPKFSHALNFKNGLAYATLENKSLMIEGYINKKGEFVWSREIRRNQDEKESD